MNSLNNMALSGQWAEQFAASRKEFIESCASAEVVYTAHGPAILINGDVINVEGKAGFDYASLLVAALRRE